MTTLVAETLTQPNEGALVSFAESAGTSGRSDQRLEIEVQSENEGDVSGLTGFVQEWAGSYTYATSRGYRQKAVRQVAEFLEIEQIPEKPEAKISPEVVYEESVSRLSGVVAIATWRSLGRIHMWTAVGSFEDELSEHVYGVEAGIYDQFPGETFDFFVQCSSESSFRRNLPPAAIVRFQRQSKINGSSEP